eukprot:403341435
MFIKNAIDMIEAHTLFGHTLVLMYNQTAFQFYINQVNIILRDSTHIQVKLENTNKTFNSMCNIIGEHCKNLKTMNGKIREASRIKYDHYRDKVNKLEKSHMKSGDAQKQAKYQRNREKYDMAKKEYESETAKVEQHLNFVKQRIDVIINHLIFKFSKDVEAYFYEEIALQLRKLQDMEEKMREVADQASQGHYGNTGGQLNLNVQF